MRRYVKMFAVAGLWFAHGAAVSHAESAWSPPQHVAAKRLVAELKAAVPKTRARAAENLGYLRAYDAADALEAALLDPSIDVRREACLSLAWCGGRKQVVPLVRVLEDADWSVRQAAWVALTNLTGMEFSFDSHAEAGVRKRQVEQWRDWWAKAREGKAPPELLAMLGEADALDLAANRPVSASSTYKGPASVLTDPARDGFWQTKNVPFPQHCTVDLGKPSRIGCVSVSQYGKGYCMTDCAVEVSVDGKSFREVWRGKKTTAPELLVEFSLVEARFVRVVSHASERAVYPTTFYSLGVYEKPPEGRRGVSTMLKRERAMRALGCLGGEDAHRAIVRSIEPYVTKRARGTEEKLMVQAGIRALGRLGGADSRDLLIQLLDNVNWARYAADALGDVGGLAVAKALVQAYPEYAMTLDGKPPGRIPHDDRPGFEAVDRMYETPHAIALALQRLCTPREPPPMWILDIAPLLVANMAGDFDGAMLYEEQAFQRVTAALLAHAGVRREICAIAFEALGCASSAPRKESLPEAVRAKLLALARKGPGGTSTAATWLTALCRDSDFVPRLMRLLEHKNGWVRINASKTLMFMKEKPAVEAIAASLEKSIPEGQVGYFGKFLFKSGKQGQDEYNAPSPNWREAFTRAVGVLGDGRHVPLLTRLLNDERNVLEVRYSAAISLDKIGSPAALDALTSAATKHPFHSIRLVAREALWKRGRSWETTPQKDGTAAAKPTEPSGTEPGEVEALVFIKGSNDMPNDFQIDIWRQTYSTTDSGPTYRLGKNLFLLKPAAPDGKATPLTSFTGGYVADCEVSWDGARVVFARRGGHDPWWHIFELDLASRDLWQLTRGPYHDVQPAYLPDGRIVFSSSRTGMRDEYHGYPATGLTVMNRDGTDIHCIGFNLGRDNEPAVLPDGNILFSRLELFYSRLKTEITVQTVRPDGTMNQTLYGPERRGFWRAITRQSGERGWGEAPPRHRVLRLTQPQPIGNQEVVVATTGGATVVGPGRMTERVIPRFRNMAVTSPFPLDANTLLCSASERTKKRKEVDLGIYTMDTESGELTLVYNDPAAADFEARPVRRRHPPPAIANSVDRAAFTARLLCNSARNSQEAITRNRGKLVRIVEGQPVTGRHHTHTSTAGQAWKNHTGTLARVLGTVPLAADGSFFVEIPADRMIHCQVLDSDRRVVGNQLIWMYARPGETRGCVGCHELPDTTPVTGQAFPLSAKSPPIKCLPTGDEFSYRGKVWQKGRLDDEAEERTRTVNAVNLPARL